MVIYPETVLECGCVAAHHDVEVRKDGVRLEDVQSADTSTGIATVVTEPPIALPDMSGVITHEVAGVVVTCPHGVVGP